MSASPPIAVAPQRNDAVCQKATYAVQQTVLYSITLSAAAIRRTGITEYWIGTAASVRLDVGRPDYLRPLFLIIYDESPEVGRRAWKHRAAKIGEARLHLRIGKRRVDLVVELVDDLRRRVLGRDKTKPPACLLAPQASGQRAHG